VAGIVGWRKSRTARTRRVPSLLLSAPGVLPDGFADHDVRFVDDAHSGAGGIDEYVAVVDVKVALYLYDLFLAIAAETPLVAVS